MIGPRRPKRTTRQEREAYAATTDRDSVDGFEQCQKCGRVGPCDRDHRQNRDLFNTTPGNLQLLGSSPARGGCGCHDWKTGNPADAIEQGFSVPSWADPLERAAWRYGVGWVLYFDDPVDGRWWREISEREAYERNDRQPF